MLGDRLRRSPPPDPTRIWPGLTEGRGALPSRPRPGFGPSPPRWAPAAHRGGGETPGADPPMGGALAAGDEGAGKGRNLRLLQSLRQNGRHLAPAQEARRALRTNQLKQIGQWAPWRAGSRYARCPGGQKEEEARLREEGARAASPDKLLAEGSVFPVTSRRQPRPHVWLQ